SGTLTFAPDETVQSFAVPILDDAVNEADETLQLTLSSPSGATLGSLATATLTILDDDTRRKVQFDASSYTVDEDTGIATITVDLSTASANTVTIDFATSNGTAHSSSDYAATSGTLTFSPGQTSKTFPVLITD